MSAKSISAFNQLAAVCRQVVSDKSCFLGRDFSITKNPSEKASAFELFLAIQRRIFQEKGQRSSEQAIAEVGDIRTIGMCITGFPSAQIKEVFFDRLVVTAQLHLFSHVTSADFPKLGSLLKGDCSGHPQAMEAIVAIKEFFHVFTQYVIYFLALDKSKQKSSFMTYVSFSGENESGETALSKINPKAREALSSDAKGFYSRSPFIRVKTFEGMAFLFRWFREKKSDADFLEKCVLVMPKVLTPKEKEMLAPLAKTGPNPEVKRLAAAALKFNEEVQQGLYLTKWITKLVPAFASLEKAMLGKEERNFPFLKDFFPLMQNLRTFILKFPRVPEKYNASGIVDLVKYFYKRIGDCEALFSGYYRYLYEDLLRLSESLPKMVLKPQLPLASDGGFPQPDAIDQLKLFAFEESPFDETDDADFIRKMNESIEGITEVISERKEKKKDSVSDQKSKAKDAGVAAAAAVVPMAPPNAKPVANPVVVPLDPLTEVFKETLFKQGIPYSAWPLLWWENPDEALGHQKYAHIVDPKIRKKIRLLHTFPDEVDRLVGTVYSLKRKWGSEDCYTLLAKVTIAGQVMYCTIQYTFNEKGECYHRCATEKDAAIFFQTWKEFENPLPFQASADKGGGVKIKGKSNSDVQMTFNPGLESIVFKTKEMEVEVIRFAEEDVQKTV